MLPPKARSKVGTATACKTRSPISPNGLVINENIFPKNERLGLFCSNGVVSKNTFNAGDKTAKSTAFLPLDLASSILVLISSTLVSISLIKGLLTAAKDCSLFTQVIETSTQGKPPCNDFQISSLIEF